MTPHNKLRLANVLMLAGIAPMPISMLWMLSTYAAAAPGKSHIGDALLVVGMACIFALVVSSSSAAWSYVLGKRNPGVRVRGTIAIRVLVALVVILPFVIGIM